MGYRASKAELHTAGTQVSLTNCVQAVILGWPTRVTEHRCAANEDILLGWAGSVGALVG